MPPIPDREYIFENMRQRRMLSMISRWQLFNSPAIKGGIRRNSPSGTQAAPEPLDAPVSLTSTDITDVGVSLSWSSVDNATNYILQRATQSDYSDASQIYSGSNTTFDDSGLTPDTTYYYRVKAQASGFTDSDYTNYSVISFTEEYQNVIERATTLGYSRPSFAQRTLQNSLVASLKTAGIWNALDFLYVFA